MPRFSFDGSEMLAPITSSFVMTPGQLYQPGRYVSMYASTAGTAQFTLADNSLHTVPVAVGYTLLNISAKSVTTTATAIISSLS